MRLKQAESAADIDGARELFKEYAAWLDVDLYFQGFEEELRELPGKYVPPDGRLLLASDEEGRLLGCVAMRRIEGKTCEMKRLYVRPAARGLGLGKELGAAIIAEARAAGYSRMLLDTLPRRMPPAIALYRSLGFQEIEAYYDNPIPGVLYLELML
ncbi:MAG: GNAT family N-acetyltransferase [Acidobacteria bacterium]|nr:GNAT family N-acetyltransferase [Acidobacteriota bacterium]